MLRELYLKDDLTWRQFGAPDERFYDRFIKNCALIVLEQHGEYFVIQDPTDAEGVFSVTAEWIAKPRAKTRRISSHAKQKSA